MRIIDESNPAAAAKPSMFLHGLTGHGKSTWAVTGGRPLVILTEPKAQSVLRQINPQAIGLAPESLDDLDGLMVYLGATEKMAAKGIDRIVLDSYTELTIAIPRWLKERTGPVGTLVQLELSEFGSLRDYALAVVKAIQLTGFPSVIIGRSVSKRVGPVEQIMPDGVGKSVSELPGKLLPTAEARFDADLGKYVIDTTPADYSQRCGLPWLPPVWDGSCLDYLRLIEAGPQGNAPNQPAAPATAQAAPAATTPAPTPKAAPAAAKGPNAPAMDARWSNAVTEFNMLTYEAGWSNEERTAAFQEWEAKGSKSLDDLQKATAKLRSEMPSATDPAWGALAKGLTHSQLAVWNKAYRANKDKAKADLEEFLEATARLRAMANCPDPEKDPSGYQTAFGDVCTALRAEKEAKGQQVSAAAEKFAAEVAVGPGRATPEDITELQDVATNLQVNMGSLWAYAVSKGAAQKDQNGTRNWLTLGKEFVARVLPQLKDKEKAQNLVAWLHKHFPQA